MMESFIPGTASVPLVKPPSTNKTVWWTLKILPYNITAGDCGYTALGIHLCSVLLDVDY